MIEMAALEEFVHVEHSSALSFDNLAASYAALTQFAPEPLGHRFISNWLCRPAVSSAAATPVLQ